MNANCLSRVSQAAAMLESVAKELGLEPMQVRLASADDGKKLMRQIDEDAGTNRTPATAPNGQFAVSGLTFYWATEPRPVKSPRPR